VFATVAAAADAGLVAVIGAVARNAWAPPRATTDLDLSVAATATVVGALGAALTALEYSCVRQHRADAADALPDLLSSFAPTTPRPGRSTCWWPRRLSRRAL